MKTDLSILDSDFDCFLLHSGGEASIYRLESESRSFALKWYRPGIGADPSILNVLKNQKFEGCYKIVEFGEKDCSTYVLYDFISGTKSSLLKLPVAIALHTLKHLAKTLSALESKGIHHGDLNPDNVIICGETDQIKTTLIDFGISGPGALAYAAPERFRGQPATTKSDLFSLGMLLYHFVTGTDLVKAQDFDAFAEASKNVEVVSPAEALYALGFCNAQELSTLSPIWKALLRENPEERAEDFEELDELLEIAISQLCSGEVALRSTIRQYVENTLPLQTKFLQETPANLPYKVHHAQSKPSLIKKLFWILVPVLMLSCLLLFLSLDSSDIDDTAQQVLKKSRSLQLEEHKGDSL